MCFTRRLGRRAVAHVGGLAAPGAFCARAGPARLSLPNELFVVVCPRRPAGRFSALWRAISQARRREARSETEPEARTHWRGEANPASPARAVSPTPARGFPPGGGST